MVLDQTLTPSILTSARIALIQEVVLVNEASNTNWVEPVKFTLCEIAIDSPAT